MLSPCQLFATRSKARVAAVLIAGAAALTLAAPAGAHHRDRPHRPDDLRVAAVRPYSVTVTWARVPGAYAYRLYRNDAARAGSASRGLSRSGASAATRAIGSACAPSIATATARAGARSGSGQATARPATPRRRRSPERPRRARRSSPGRARGRAPSRSPSSTSGVAAPTTVAPARPSSARPTRRTWSAPRTRASPCAFA
jgi:hypothetical protein